MCLVINGYSGSKGTSCKLAPAREAGYKFLPDNPQDYLNEMVTFTKKYSEVPGFKLEKGATYAQDGFYHGMRHANNLPTSDAGRINAFDMKFEEEGLPCVGCKFDIRFSESPGSLKYIEYKSYQNASNISLDQFTNYVNGINDINQLNYVFNSAKLSESAARTGIRSFFLKSGNAEAIWNANPSLFINLNLPNGLPVIDIDDFKQFLTETNATHSFYYFVKSF